MNLIMGNSEKYPEGKKHLLNIVIGNRRGLIEHKDKTSRDLSTIYLKIETAT